MRLCPKFFLAVLFFAALFPAITRAQNVETPKTILVLGDSLAAGYGVDPEEAWPALLQQKIDAAKLNGKVINAGVSGDTSADGLQRADWLLRRKIDILILELGGNDGLRGLPTAGTEANLQSIIDRVRGKYPAVKIIVAGMRMPPNLGAEYTESFARIFPDLATKNHALLVPFLLEGVAAKAELNQGDGIHPLPAGHKIVADTVWKTLKPLL